MPLDQQATADVYHPIKGPNIIVRKKNNWLQLVVKNTCRIFSECITFTSLTPLLWQIISMYLEV